MTEQEKEVKAMSALDVFASTQETFDEAKEKSKKESGNRVDYFRFEKDGTYAVRILPLAPVIDADGNVLPMDRKGYEYPLRTLMLKIASAETDKQGKPKTTFVSVCNVQHAFKNKIKEDLIDAYLRRACELHNDDEALCKKLREGSYNGGLRWGNKRCMYALDLDTPADGIKILQLSYSQYKDLEERKLNNWEKLNKKGGKAPCPISSIQGAYPVEIIRKSENNKVSYSFNIDTLSGTLPLSEEECNKLLDMPRLPETLYRYTRRHLEATIVYLTQLDEKYDIDVMHDEEVQNCIEQIKCLLPADDQSHFTIDRKGAEDNANDAAADITMDSMWDLYDHIEGEGLDDKSEEGQELRTMIKEYIESNKLDVRISHTKSNFDLLNTIEEILKEENATVDEGEKNASKQSSASNTCEASEDENDDEPAMPDDEPEDFPPTDREYNDDTNEPALRSRRSARPVRHR